MLGTLLTYCTDCKNRSQRIGSQTEAQILNLVSSTILYFPNCEVMGWFSSDDRRVVIQGVDNTDLAFLSLFLPFFLSFPSRLLLHLLCFCFLFLLHSLLSKELSPELETDRNFLCFLFLLSGDINCECDLESDFHLCSLSGDLVINVLWWGMGVVSTHCP